MPKIVLIMGLPGAGKSTLAAGVTSSLFFTTKVLWLNADTVREQFNDWDFTIEGRLRQARRMKSIATASEAEIVIIDMIAPIEIMREIIVPDILVWVDTIDTSIYADTNSMFVPPTDYTIRVTEKDCVTWAPQIVEKVLSL